MKCAIFDQWTANIVSVEGLTDDCEQISYNLAYLRYMHFCYTCITGGRMYTVQGDEKGFPNEASIIAACLREAYELADEGAGEDRLDSGCYGFEM